MMPSPSHPTTLTATYTSPLTTQTFLHHLPSPTPTSLAQKTAYLSHLRQRMTQLQEHVNILLTAKMEEDKAVAARAGVDGQVDEKKEEDVYGEEDVEEGGG